MTMVNPEPESPRAPPGGPPRVTPPEQSRPPWISIAISTVLLVLFLVYQARITHGVQEGTVDYSQFYGWVEAGKVQKVTIDGREVIGTLKAPEKIDGHDVSEFRATLPSQEDRDLLPLLREKAVDVTATADQSPLSALLLSFLPWIIVLGGWWWLSRRAAQSLAGASSGGPLGGFMRGRNRRFEPQQEVRVRFDDVAGLQSALFAADNPAQ